MPEKTRSEQPPKPRQELSQWETAMMIADRLGEHDQDRRKYIGYVVRILGRTQSRQLCQQSLDSCGERAAGEVFFDLAQSRGKAKRGQLLRPFEIRGRDARAEAASRWEVASEIADRLGESEEFQRQQIGHLVWALGEAQVRALLQEAIRISEGEGMLVPDGSRRRTVGGIFFYLAYYRGVPEEGKVLRRTTNTGRVQVVRRGRARVEVKEPQPEAQPLLVWEDRIAVLREAEEMKGQANVKITLVGRPGKIVDQGQCVATVMESGKVPALPKGLPTPPTTPTKYTVYIGSKQWKKVAEAIRDPEDVLIIEGFPTMDPQTSSIAVFATNTTTKKLQIAQKEAQKTKSEATAS